MSLEQKLNALTKKRYRKSIEECGNKEIYYSLLSYRHCRVCLLLSF